jgi:hypothetical protein
MLLNTSRSFSSSSYYYYHHSTKYRHISPYIYHSLFLQADDTRLQDQDKMITFDTARVQYSSYRLFLALDSDELLVPDPRSPLFRQFQLKHSSSWGGGSGSRIIGDLFKKEGNPKDLYPPAGFKAFLTKSLSKAALANTEEIMLFRYSAAATTPTGVIHSKKISKDGDMVAYTSACLHAGRLMAGGCCCV